MSHTTRGIVFDIKGNDYRVIVVIKFQFSTVKLEHVFTHSEYGKAVLLKLKGLRFLVYLI